MGLFKVLLSWITTPELESNSCGEEHVEMISRPTERIMIVVPIELKTWMRNLNTHENSVVTIVSNIIVDILSWSISPYPSMGIIAISSSENIGFTLCKGRLSETWFTVGHNIEILNIGSTFSDDTDY